jgi:hypothetical protein
LADNLTALVDEFWEAYPETNVDFLVECMRFCEFLLAKHQNGFVLTDEALDAFQREYADLRLRMLATRTVL